MCFLHCKKVVGRLRNIGCKLCPCQVDAAVGSYFRPSHSFLQRDAVAVLFCCWNKYLQMSQEAARSVGHSCNIQSCLAL